MIVDPSHSAAQLLGGTSVDDPFVHLLYAGPGAGSLADTPRETLLAEAAATCAFMRDRTPATPAIRIRPHTANTGAGPHRMVLEIVNDDMPFLVDSVVGELNARGLRAHLVLHPIVKVQRDATGQLQAIMGGGDRLWSAGGQESVMVIHLDALSSADASALQQGLQVALEDVRRATGDWRAMLAALDQLTTTYQRTPPPISSEALIETLAFCAWLRDGHFTFLGARAHTLKGQGADAEFVPVSGSSLGILRDASIATLARGGGEPITLKPAPIDPRTPVATSSGLLTIAKSSILSRVHRRVLMDYVTLTTVDASGTVTGDIRFVGLFTQHAYTQPVREIPVLRQRAAAVLGASGLPPDSHTGKTLATALDTMPRDEMFQLTMPELTAWAGGMVDLDLRPRVRLFTRTDPYGRFVSALLFIPRDRFSTSVRERIAGVIAEASGGTITSFTPFFTEGPLVRVHFIIDTPDAGKAGGAAISTAALEARIDEMSRGWDERLAEQLTASRANGAGTPGATPTTAALGNYAGAFSAGYTETFGPERALQDIQRIERLSEAAPIAIDFYRTQPASPTTSIRAAIYRFGQPIPLSERVPILENMGFSAIDERSYRVTPAYPDGPRQVALHDMVLAPTDGQPVDLDRHDQRMEGTYLAVERGAADNDPFNRLVIAASADWREVVVMRALAAYMRQIRSPFGPRYIADTLVRHAGIARDLIEVFRTSHDPDLFTDDTAGDARRVAATKLFTRIEGALAGVESLDEDRILRAIVNLLRACLRTNFFQKDANGEPPATLALKFDPRMIDGLPHPKPYREIFVYSPRVEGVHLRFGPVARGGIRWSDRAQDFRTEVLGLCKAQQVKNTVIVPTGSKGGFIPKFLPRSGSRDEVMKEGIAAYQIFVGTLLDITDNIAGGEIVPPSRTVRHDGDDPYLVVAADKGTATFSDFANAIATSRGFWLGDAFASGGSVGYDHKKMAITARGGWECVKRHFREMDWDIQTKPFRVIGVGDMSGDVFGNGMLLSPVIRLTAAFDHRDIFLDPNPDPAVSFAERQRMFDLPRSSWANYDATKISAGGGVFPRGAKSVALSPQVQQMLGVTAASMTPAELMHTILMADTDLLWFGGIGTYVKAATETDEQVGDRANDTIRVAGSELQCKVIGEGANLALTQRGRMEFANRGGRLNTDFIDNSAGVNSSDQEVNIKIALGDAIAAGRLKAEDRNSLLASMTDDVAAGCLVNNTQQSLALSLAERRSVRDIGYLAELMRSLERRGLLDRALEALPADRDIAAREMAKTGMTRPELAVLLSWSKIALSADLSHTKVPEDPATQPLLIDYFPPALRQRFEPQLRQHRLARDIVTMRVTNSIINRGGPTFVTQLLDETGRSTADIAYAYLAVRSIFMLPELWNDLDALDNRMPGDQQLALYAATQDTLYAETASVLRSGADQTLGDMIARYRPTAEALPGLLARVLTAAQKTDFEAATTRLKAEGVPESVAVRIAALPAMGRAISIARLVAESRQPVETAARAQYAADEAVQLPALKARADSIAIGDYYDRLALTGALGALEAASTQLARQALAASGGGGPDAISAHISNRGPMLAKATATLGELATRPTLTVSRLVVAAGHLRDVVGT